MTDTSDPSRIMMRRIAGSFAQYEKARLVGKLRAARERHRAETGKRGGRKTCAAARSHRPRKKSSTINGSHIARFRPSLHGKVT